MDSHNVKKPSRVMAAIVLALLVVGGYGLFLVSWLKQSDEKTQMSKLTPGETAFENAFRAAKVLPDPLGWGPKALGVFRYLNDHHYLTSPLTPWKWTNLPEEFNNLQWGDFPTVEDSASVLLWGTTILTRDSDPVKNPDIALLKDKITSEILRGATTVPIALLNAWKERGFPEDPELEAWMGSAVSIEALKTDNVFEKVDRVKEGSDLLNKAVSQAPKNSVARTIRCSTFLTLPSFFTDLRAVGYQDLVLLGQWLQMKQPTERVNKFFQVEHWDMDPELWQELFNSTMKESGWNFQQLGILQSISAELKND